MKNISFKVEEDIYQYFKGHAEEDGHSMNYVLRALVSGYAFHELTVVSGHAVPGKAPTSSATAQTGSFVSPKPRGRPPTDPLSAPVPGFGTLREKVRYEIRCGNQVMRDKYPEEAAAFDKANEGGTLIEKAELPPNHTFLGDKR